MLIQPELCSDLLHHILFGFLGIINYKFLLSFSFSTLYGSKATLKIRIGSLADACLFPCSPKGNHDCKETGMPFKQIGQGSASDNKPLLQEGNLVLRWGRAYVFIGMIFVRAEKACHGSIVKNIQAAVFFLMLFYFFPQEFKCC